MLLLRWGEQQLGHLAPLDLSQAELDEAASALRRALRTVNRLIERRAELSDTEIVQHLLKIVDQVIFLTTTIQRTTNRRENRDQKTET
jgi:hypothetical protein